MDVALAPLEMNEFNDSKSEIKVAECGRYKIPLIATDCGAYDEWIENGETGFLIDAKKPISEWTKILTMCAKRPDMVKRMGENLHQKTEEAFDMNKVVGARLDLYKELLVASQAS
jgi:glycosyltransferase involved in cell wall biosynthesis